MMATLIGWTQAESLRGMENAPCIDTFAHLLGIDPGPHSGVGPRGAGNAQSAKASSMVLMLFLLLHRHAVPLISPATRSAC